MSFVPSPPPGVSYTFMPEDDRRHWAIVLSLVAALVVSAVWCGSVVADRQERTECVWSPQPDREDVRACAPARYMHDCMVALGYEWQCHVREESK